ncbi:cob(I)yrinic acid a,c-diamide adenosyltransferase [Pseudonocardia sp. NPDC049635]|uniref:cob(I)yrinic acid a,c-diamide adenosyltransferase n=1 Tax=Pseudonocardia sp. NPDC049635 TaxID=3155506 RepID=UPI0033E6B7D3
MEPGPGPARRPRDDLVLLFTGEGWGKTAAAVGYAVRARGAGWPATVVQFLKGGGWNAAEIAMADRLGVGWPVLTRGLTWAHDPEQLCARAWAAAVAALAGRGPALVVLDEITHAIDNGWLDAAEVARAVSDRAPGVSAVLTGRNTHPEVVDIADTVTRFELVKHDGKRGILAP